ncbi:hypothetical protein PFFVO_06003, partial [Plasmodium falciparum Vietnam Oak-Knoll (FVO)]
MAPPSAVTDYSDANDAKELLDKIGQQVHDQVQTDAKTYDSYLKGNLARSSIFVGERGGTTDTCDLVKQYYNNHVNRERYPCTELGGKVVVERFSDTLGGQCTDQQIEGNDRKNGGACAPYRRLHLCHHNLESIETTSTAKHDLLLEVCMAAKYEGESLTRFNPKYPEIYSGSTMCTMLARSFADIGDIVRGRDIFRGNDEEKKKRDELENKLKEIFKKIHSGLSKNGAKDYYQDENGENFFKLREDWWYANRQEIWKAITCDDDKKLASASYFRPTCDSVDGKGPSQAQNRCRCKKNDDTSDTDQVPTYFDYVPQFLRWFEEWAEDFCRKKKKKLENLEQQCRGEGGKERYCSGNGYDCEKTIYKKGKLVISSECTKCSVWCRMYETWIDNQKKEFIKQKRKYTSEMQKYTNGASKGTTTITTGNGKTINNWYVKEFYKKLKKGDYGKVDAFLKLLNKENECKDINEEKEKIDFSKKVKDHININSQGTFYHSEYCEVCPDCGVERKDEKWENKPDDDKCKNIKLYTPKKGVVGTPIEILKSGEKQKEIAKNLKTFCETKNGSAGGGGGGVASVASGSNSEMKELIEKWECYKHNEVQKVGQDDEDDDDGELKGAGGLCILQNTNKTSDKEPEQFQKTFNEFFYFWIGRFLNDSMYWRGKVGGCLKNGAKTCGNQKCKGNCECFKRWIGKKKTEWGNIVKHFKTQDFGSNVLLGKGMTPDFVLKTVLNIDELFNNIKSGYGDVKETEGINKILDEEKKREKEATGVLVGVVGSGGEDNTTIDKLLDHEDKDATKCKNCQPTKIRNPCSGDKTGDQRYEAVAQTVAKILQQKAHTDMLQRSGKNGDSVLKGDISKATFKSGANPSELKNVCQITEKHSNATGESNNPCNGKGDGLQIGETWEDENSKSNTLGMHIRPRRKHMCTSNLEKINVGNVTQNGNINPSFLVDVLLAAKEEAEDIKKKYKEIKDKNGLKDDQVTTCRAIKSSFADIGDIIRGRDLWENGEAKSLQGNLVTIFGHIHSSLNGKGKYASDEKNNPPYKQLREDWWALNRETVWDAMKCKTNGVDITCDSDVPFDDYIPQGLRWMTEWAEWYCKAQAEAYGELLQKCGNCKDKIKGHGQCKEGNKECTVCKSSCKKYTEFVNKWKPQWNKMDMKYTPLYLQAKNPYPGIVFPGADYQLMVDFLSKLHTENIAASSKSSTTRVTATPPNTDVYSTAAGYIHQEARVGKCLEQNVFCNTNGNNEKYAFKNPPPQYKDACECKPPQQENPGRSRGTTPHAGSGDASSDDDDDEDDENEEEDDEEEEDEVEEEAESKDVEDGAASEVETPPKKKDTTSLDVCTTVKSALEDMGSLTKACQQKYGLPQRHWGWKCVTSGKDTGSICVPPRRRRLYVKDLENIKESSSHVDLRDAFIQSAAVETFFLWHKFKKDKEIEKREKNRADGIVPGTSVLHDEDEDEANKNKDPQQLLQEKGEIPEEFKRQMFYTLGDYRDICIGKRPDGIDTVSASDKDTMDKIQKKIKEILPKNGDTVPGQKSVDPRKTWWQTFGPSIWEGMICALSYDTDKTDDKKIKKNEQVETKLKEKLKKENGEYHYKNVVLKDENSGTDGPKSTEAPTHLSKFVLRPPYFRYLEEWGETFCRQRTRMLKQIKEDCRGVGGRYSNRYSSGDGEDCTKIGNDKNKTFRTFDYSTCANLCRSYKKWIETKRKEFEEQKKAYGEQRTNYTIKNKVSETNSHDNGFCETLEATYTEAKDFLKTLGPCSKKDDDSGQDEIKFDDEGKTFGHETYCDPCPVFGVKCNKGDCKGAKEIVCNGKTFKTPDDITNMQETNDVDMLVSDKSGNGFNDDLKVCKTSGIFKGFRKDLWTCVELCNSDICVLKNSDEKKDVKEYVQIRTLFIQWLEHFLEDYNKINKKLKPCMKKDDKSTCISGCHDKCNCVKKWVDKKKIEWPKIRERYLNPYKNDDGNDMKSLVTSFMETLIPQIPVVTDKGKHDSLEKLVKSLKCQCTAKSEKKNTDERDVIDCMITNLQQKIGECEKNHDPSDKECNETLAQTPDETLDDDIETEEAKKM